MNKRSNLAEIVILLGKNGEQIGPSIKYDPESLLPVPGDMLQVDANGGGDTVICEYRLFHYVQGALKHVTIMVK